MGRVIGTEVILRVCIIFLLLLTSLLVGLDTQTETVALINKKVTFKALVALQVGLYINVVAAAYNMVQLGYGCFGVKPKTTNCKWISYLLDQIAAYVVFSGTSAATQHSLLVITGSKELQWMKWCNKYTRFCFQIGGALTVNYIAAALMLIVSSLSAFNLFRLYSSKQYFRLKSSS